MNERIREVWIKAAREDSDPDNWDTQEQFIERFADVLLREYVGMLEAKLDELHKTVVYSESQWQTREAQISLLTNLIEEAKELK